MGRLKSAEARKGTSTKRSVGAYGSRRNTPARAAKQVTRREMRLAEPRVREALDDARKADAEIEALMRAQRANPEIAAGKTQGAEWAEQIKLAEAEARANERTTVKYAAAIYSGKRCENEDCERPFDKCHKLTAGQRGACCDCCSSYETHDSVLVKERHLFEPYEGNGNEDWSLRFARSWVREGYHVKNVMRRTGVGFRWLEDLVGPDGYVK